MANDVAKRAAFKYLFDLITERSKVKKNKKEKRQPLLGGGRICFLMRVISTL